MQIGLRSTLAAGVAAVGAGVIAVTPTLAPPAPVATPQAASSDVALGALAALLPPPSIGERYWVSATRLPVAPTSR
jgi:hypothetical protein